jgi:hypothetical protein
MRFVVLFAGLVVASLAVPTVARAAGPAFGGAGQLVVSDDQPLGSGALGSSGLVAPTPPASISSVSFEFGALSNSGGSGTEFALAPAADYFVIPNLSVGGNILFGILSPAHGSGAASGPGTTYTLFGIAPRVGYNIPLKLYFGYTTLSGSGGGGGANAASLGIFAPIMFVPATHFVLGIGPNFSTQLSSNVTSGSTSASAAKLTQVGIQATIGGWFLGD